MKIEKFDGHHRREPSESKSVESLFEKLTWEESHNLSERLESDVFELQNDLTELAKTIPEGTSEKAEADSVLEFFRSSIGKRLQIAVFALAAASPLGGHANDTETEASDSDRYVESQLEASGGISETLSVLKEKVWTDGHETMYIRFGKKDQEEIVFTVGGNTGDNFVMSSEEDEASLERRIASAKQNESRIISQHNHPVKVIADSLSGSLSKDQYEALKSGEIVTAVAPPGMIDLFYKPTVSHGMDMINYVAGPSGVWTHTEITDHPVTILVNEIREINLVNLLGQDGQNLEEVNIDAHLPQVIGTMDIAVKHLELRAQNELGFSFNQTFTDLAETTEQIRQRSVAGEDVSKLIELYVDLSGQLGIAVEYEPNLAE